MLNKTVNGLSRATGDFVNGSAERGLTWLEARDLVRFAARQGVDDAAVDALFTAYFAEGADIADHAVLTRIAIALGLEAGAALRFLASGQETEAVHADNLRAHRLGINGVPCFVVQGRHAIAGAQEPEVLERLLDVALVEAHGAG